MRGLESRKYGDAYNFLADFFYIIPTSLLERVLFSVCGRYRTLASNLTRFSAYRFWARSVSQIRDRCLKIDLLFNGLYSHI